MVRKILREYRIVYRWGFPTKFIVSYQNKTISLHNVDGALKALPNWGLDVTNVPKVHRRPPLSRVQSDWLTVGKA